MENNTTETSGPASSTVARSSKPHRDDDARGIKRENDSMDDFEHLEHEGSPNEETRVASEMKKFADGSSRQLIDLPGDEKISGEDVDGEVEGGRTGSSPAGDLERNILDTSVPGDEKMLQPVPAGPPPSADHEHRDEAEAARGPKDLVEDRPDDAAVELPREARMDAKAASLAFMEMERADEFSQPPSNLPVNLASLERRAEDAVEPTRLSHEKIDDREWTVDSGIEDTSVVAKNDDSLARKSHDFVSNVASSVLPVPEKSPEYDFLAGETSPNFEAKKIDDDTWNVVERPEARIASRVENGEVEVARGERDDEAPVKPLPPLPRSEIEEEDHRRRTNYPSMEQHAHDDVYEMSNDYESPAGKTSGQQQQSGAETGDSEFESAPEQSPAKTSGKTNSETAGANYRGRKTDENYDIAPKEIFTDMGLDAWFNPERLNPKVAALIYWRQPEKTGIVFGAILGVLLSLAYFSLISVFAYLSLLTLCGTVGFRVYKTFVQAVQKTTDGHPFKDILEVDLTLPAEKVHEVADVAVAHANATVAELRRLFLVEDFIDSFKFGVCLWCLTYLGSWFNGMTLIIIGVVALFTLPKVYETNMAQIDQNVALVRGKINELTAKVKAAIPLGKKSEPTKEE